MKRRWRVLLRIVGALALSIALWFGWGAWNAGRVDERLAAMHADGSLSTFEALQGPPPREEENGWSLLHEADELAREIDRRVFDELLKEGTTDLRYAPDDREAWTPEQVDHERRVLREIAPAFTKLDEALQRPALVRLGTPPLDSSGFMTILGHLQRLLRRMRMEPARHSEDVDRMLTLMDRWNVRDGDDADVRIVLWRTLVLRGLREGLEDGHVGNTPRGVSHGILRREEQRLFSSAALAAAWKRATVVWLVQCWRRYEDPLAATRASIARVWNAVPWSLVESADREDQVAQLGDLVHRARGTGAPPWYASWYGRPLLEARVHEVLDALASEPPAPTTLEELRAAALIEDPTQAYGSRSLLHTLTALRLARVALAVRGAVEHGIGKPFDLRLGVAARLGGQHLHDPLSDKLFVLDAREDHVVVTVRSSEALEAVRGAYARLEGEAREARLHEDLLLWRIPAP